MAGHNKWKQIKYKKAASDAKRGKIFSKISRTITISVKEFGDDPKMNPRLAAAIEEARAVNMPNDNIDRAVKKATDKDSSDLKDVLYEAYGPGGSALLITAITDNSNRTTHEIKHLLSEYGGKWGEQGSVMWAFEKKGKEYEAKFPLTLSLDDMKKMDILLEALDDYDDVDDVFTNMAENDSSV